MKPIAGALPFMACALSACSLSFGTVGAWSADKPPPISLTGSTSVAMPDGEVIFLGGFDPRGGPLDRVLRFEPKDKSWSLGSPVPVQGGGYAIAALSSGSLLIAGGFGSESGSLLATTWLYSPELNTWQKVGNLHVPRSDAAAVLLTDGRVLIAGGTTQLATPVQGLPAGGTDLSGGGTSTEIFDPLSNSWSLVGSMQVARAPMALVALPHGMALAAGGCSVTDQELATVTPLSSAEIFDPATDAWALTRPLPEPRCGASGVRLNDGRALVSGGYLSFPEESVTDAVLYDERNRDWVAAGSTVQGASAPILLSDGQVFVAAVQAGTPKGGLETETVGGKLFDPASGDWTYATSTSVRVSFRVGLEQVPPLVEESGGSAVVLLGTADLVFTFDPTGVPPPVLILDSSGLSLILAGLVVALCLWLAIHYVRNRSAKNLERAHLD